MRRSLLLQRLKFFILKFWKELFATLITVCLAVLTLVFVTRPKKLFIASLFIAAFGLCVTVYVLRRSRDFYYQSLTSRKDLDKWFGDGQFKLDRINQSYVIEDSEAGFIFSPALLWDDYSVDFDFKIQNICLGVIVRGFNLSNYVMLQITENGVRPHVRVNGGWYWQEAEQAGLLYSNKFNKDEWYRCKVACDKNCIDIKIYNGKKKILDSQWSIPPGQVKFTYKDEEGKHPVDIYYPINLEYGSYGFRNNGPERALVRNLRGKKI